MATWRVRARLQQLSLCGTFHQTTNSTCFITCCLSNATENDPTVQSQLRSINPARQQPPTAVCPPTVQYQDINYWQLLSIRTVANGNIFIRPNYDKRTCDHKLPLIRLFAAVSLLQELTSCLAENTRTITLIVHIKCKYCKIQQLPVTVRRTVIIRRFGYLHFIPRIDLMLARNVLKLHAWRSENSTQNTRCSPTKTFKASNQLKTKMDLKSAFPLSLTVTAVRTLYLLHIPYHAFMVQTLLSGTNSVDIIQVTAFEEKVKSKCHVVFLSLRLSSAWSGCSTKHVYTNRPPHRPP